MSEPRHITNLKHEIDILLTEIEALSFNDDRESIARYNWLRADVEKKIDTLERYMKDWNRRCHNLRPVR